MYSKNIFRRNTKKVNEILANNKINILGRESELVKEYQMRKMKI